MVETLELSEILQKEEEFYSRGFYFSYSSITRLLNNPESFYRHYILGQKEDTESQAALEGRIVHCLVLTPELFESTYLVSPGTVPEGNPKIIIDQIFALYKTEVEGENPREEFCEYRDEILDIMKNINYFQKLVDDKELTGDQKRLNKVCTPENIGYFNFLKQALQKTIISQEMYTNCQRAAERVKNHPEAASQIGRAHV